MALALHMVVPSAPREEADGNLLAAAAEKVHTVEERGVGVVITKEITKETTKEAPIEAPIEAITAEIEDKNLDKTNTV